MDGILEEKTVNGGIWIGGGCPETLQAKAREFSERVAQGRHYFDLEVGFIRGYQTAVKEACKYLESVFKDLAGYNCGSDYLESFEKHMNS